MATTAERWHFDLRQLLAKDPGILGRAAKTVWVDRTPMKDRIDGETNSTNPQKGGALTRRDFLRISAIASGAGLAAACAPNLLRTPTTSPATAVSSIPTELPTKSAVELGIQYDEVAVLDEASAVAEMAKIGIPLDLAYAGAIKGFQDVNNYPQLKLEGASYDKFAIVVPYVGMDEKKLRYIYPFIGVQAVDANSSFVAIMIPQYDKQGALTGFAAESLEATEVEFAGAKRGALSVFKDPATGADISPRPVFIYPTDIAGWKQMTDAQRRAQAIIFIPYNLPSPKEIRITGGKLAKLVVDMATATPEPQKPTETKSPQESTRHVNDYLGLGPVDIYTDKNVDFTQQKTRDLKDSLSKGIVPKALTIGDLNTIDDGYGILPGVHLDNVIFSGYKMQRVVFNPGASDQYQLYMANLSFVYYDRSSNSVKSFALESRGKFGTKRDVYTIDPATLESRIGIGTSLNIDIRFAPNGLNMEKLRASDLQISGSDAHKLIDNVFFDGTFGKKALTKAGVLDKLNQAYAIFSPEEVSLYGIEK